MKEIDFYSWLGQKIEDIDWIKTNGKMVKKPKKIANSVYHFVHPGIEIDTDYNNEVQNIFIHGVEEGKSGIYEGPLMTGVKMNNSRVEINKILGKPNISGEPEGFGIMEILYSWDKWINPQGQSIHIQYEKGNKSIWLVTISDVPMSIDVLFEGLIDCSHHSFYLQDIESKEDAGVIWVEAAKKQFIFPGDQMIGISIPRYGQTTFNMSLISKHIPIVTLDGLDQCNECSIQVTKGLKVGHEVVCSWHKLEVKPGIYRCRITSTFLHTVKDDDQGKDLFTILMWPEQKLRDAEFIK